jgi:hypothetical protein
MVRVQVYPLVPQDSKGQDLLVIINKDEHEKDIVAIAPT